VGSTPTTSTIFDFVISNLRAFRLTGDGEFAYRAGSNSPRNNRAARAVASDVNYKGYDPVLYSLDHSIELFSRLPALTSASAAAFDTLKQARAMLADALQEEQSQYSQRSQQLART
jgi:hypothetical protein